MAMHARRACMATRTTRTGGLREAMCGAVSFSLVRIQFTLFGLGSHSLNVFHDTLSLNVTSPHGMMLLHSGAH